MKRENSLVEMAGVLTAALFAGLVAWTCVSYCARWMAKPHPPAARPVSLEKR